MGEGGRIAHDPAAPGVLRPRREVCRDPFPPLVLVVVRDFHELEGVAVGILEVHPPPSGKHTFVDDVDVAVELDSLGLELGLLRVDVVDEEGDVGGAEVVAT